MAFGQLCSMIATSNALLADIQQLMANPLSTAAAERYRRGLHALREGWYAEAIEEFSASAEQDPFQAPTHFALGVALGANGDPERAVESFGLAERYAGSDPALVPVRAGAAILGARAANDAGKPELARQIAVRAAEQLPQCAELQLAAAKESGSVELLSSALWTGPELATIALVAGIAETPDTAARLAADPSSPIGAMAAAVRDAKLLGLPLDLPEETPELMEFHHVWRSGLASKARSIGRTVVAERDQLRADVEAAKKEHARLYLPRVDDAKSDFAAAKVAGVISAAFGIWMIATFVMAATGGSAHAVAGGPNPLMMFGIALALPTFIAGAFAYSKYSNAEFDQQKSRSKRRMSEQEKDALQRRVDGLERQLESADVRAERAEVLLENIEKSLPQRIYPLVAPPTAG